MFINPDSKTDTGLKDYSIRRHQNGMYYVVNDSGTGYDPNPPVRSGMLKKDAEREAASLNNKRGPEYGYSFRG